MGENRELVTNLFDQLLIPVESQKEKLIISSESQITGKSFCVTGSFDNMSRDQIHEMIESHGGEVRSSVSSKLDFLIA